MARSHAIWVVMLIDSRINLGKPVAAFTVKRELAHWYAAQDNTALLRLYRCENPVSNSGGRLGRFINTSEPVPESWDEVNKIIEREGDDDHCTPLTRPATE